ncbi:hypothetical protein ACROYT_G000903 [Oculina patagonica]
MRNCKSSSGYGISDYCWIAADSGGSYLRCGGSSDCEGAANSWGNCKAASCAFDRAPDPYKSPEETCEHMNNHKADELKNECRSYSFEKWLRDYNTPRKVYAKFDPCVGGIIEEETKKVIKYCHCYNSCGKTQTDNGDCEVLGLDRRLDWEADTKTTYTAVCKIDCDPTDKYVFLASLRNDKTNKANLKVTITKGMTQSKTTSSGGSASVTVSGEVGFDVLEVFSVKLGVSGTTGFDWSSSSTASSFQQRSYEISVPVDGGDEVNVYQVIGECDNDDGTKYTVETTKYEIRDKGGKVVSTAEVPSDE